MDALATHRRVRIRPVRVLVRLACLISVALSACSVPADPAWTPTAPPVPTSSTGCGLQSLPQTWQEATAPSRLTPTRSVRLLAHDAATGRSLYAKEGSGVVLAEPGQTPREVFAVSSPMVVWAAALDGDWMVFLTMNEVRGPIVLTAMHLGGRPVQLFPSGAYGQAVLPGVVLRDGVLYAAVIANVDEKISTVVAVDLESGHVEPIPGTDQVAYILGWGAMVLLVDPASDVGGRVRAIEPKTLHAVSVPPVLANLGDTSLTASDGATVAWAALQEASVMVVRQGWTAPRTYTLPGDRIEQLSVWGRYVVEASAERFWILDVETGQYAPVTTWWGDAKVSGGLLASSETASEKGGSAGLRELDLTSVPNLPGCTR